MKKNYSCIKSAFCLIKHMVPYGGGNSWLIQKRIYTDYVWWDNLNIMSGELKTFDPNNILIGKILILKN
jgi:hypothetical protein